MADEDDGATPSELLLEACRRNNTSLLQTVIAQISQIPQTQKQSSTSNAQSLASLLNNTLDPLGRTPLHICAASGADETLDLLLDQEGLEVEPRERHGGDTPLHCAVRYVMETYAEYVRSSPQQEEEEEEVIKGLMAGVELLLDAGADPRIRNEFGRGVKPEGLLVGGNRKGLGLLREVLVKCEDELTVKELLVREVGQGQGQGQGEGEGDEEGPTGSQSDSD